MNDLLNNLKVNETENLSAATTKEALPPIDAVIHVSLANNKIEAYIFMDPPMNGGVPPTLKLLEAALEKAAITYGVNRAKLKEIAENPIYNQNIMIAQGSMPENGVNGTYQFKIRLEKDCKPKEKQDGTVDYRDLDMVENVSKGQLLCMITPPTGGVEGMAVTGEKLLPVKGKAAPSFTGENTELSEDGTAIYSKIDGQVDYNGRKINVSETLCIRGDVDNTTGNVKVVGNVVIGGTVLPKFVVEATGNIEIRGTVASAVLKADGNIILRSGTIGCELCCKGDLTSRFIENCNIVVNGNVTADYIVSSNIQCGKSVQLIGSKGTILGGTCVARQNIEARIIGSIAEVETDLKIGTDPAIIRRQQELKNQLPDLEKQISSLKSLISLLQQFELAKRLTPDKKITLDQALLSHETCIALFESCKQELVELNETLQKKGFGKVLCSGKIFPGTNIEIDSAKVHVIDVLTSTSLYYSKGEICQGSVR